MKKKTKTTSQAERASKKFVLLITLAAIVSSVVPIALCVLIVLASDS